MSSRQLRKLQQLRELEQAKLQAEDEEESEEEPFASLPQKSKGSLFASFAALDDADEDQKDDEKEAVESPHESSEPEPEATAAPAPKAKKSKKKKKGKNNKPRDNKPIEDEKHEDEIDAALRELDIKAPGTSAVATESTLDPEYERVCALLGISWQHLKVANEMRNLFGRAALENHDDAGGPVGRGARRRQRGQDQQVDLETALKGHHSPGKGLPELILRRNNFIQGKDEWPRGTTGGLIMAIVDDQSEDGTVVFRYAHDQAYQTLQRTFQGFVEMGEPQNLIALLIRNPYHISLLIQVSKIAKNQTDHALSSDLLERALFNLGRASTSLFNTKLSQGKARLEFGRPENREIWLAGFHYIKSLVMKGTYRTALEWAKLLLSLNIRRDPYCMRLMIHHLALRAHEFKWLLDLEDSKWGKECEERAISKGHNPAIFHILPSLAFAALQLREGAKCRELLSDSMNKVPWLFFRLFKELDLDAPPSIWGAEPRTDAERLFTEIYVLQTKDLWNTPEATSLLMEIAHTIPKVDVATIPTVDNAEMTLDVVRFVYLDNTPALMALAPSHLLHRSNNSDSDPLPPDANTISYESQRITLQEHGGRREVGDDFFDPLAAIARLIPGLRRRANEQRGEDVEQDEEMDAAYEEMVHAELTAAIRNEDGGQPAEGGGQRRLAQGVLGRILTSIFGVSRGDEDYDSENDSSRTDTDTDDHMPGLEERSEEEEEEEQEEDKDELPDLE